jgi:DNA adenine methylase
MSSSYKPILKWVGGKTQIMDKLIQEFPVEINNYHEIFLGGGSVLFNLLKNIDSGLIHVTNKIYAYDVNEPLIFVYKNIQTNCENVYKELQNLIKSFNECGCDGKVNRKATNITDATCNKENYYYWLRKEYNSFSKEEKTTCKGSALFIFLNKTCFRGVFRVGPNGFNVPYGHYSNPEIINEKHIKAVSVLIKDVIFECCDFIVSLQRVVGEDDFVYLDPPYAPENTLSFVGYTEKGFPLEKHKELFSLIHELNDKKINIILSNSEVDLVVKSFDKEVYSVSTIVCKRSINSKKPQSKTNEVIIKNF